MGAKADSDYGLINKLQDHESLETVLSHRSAPMFTFGDENLRTKNHIGRLSYENRKVPKAQRICYSKCFACILRDRRMQLKDIGKQELDDAQISKLRLHQDEVPDRHACEIYNALKEKGKTPPLSLWPGEPVYLNEGIPWGPNISTTKVLQTSTW